MSQVCRLTINGDVVAANPGDLLLDAALMNGIELPHDCRSGYCGTCRVRVLAGRCLGGASDIPNVIHACQTRVISDLTVVLEKVPEIVQVSGEIAGLVNVAPDVVEVCIESREPFDYLPGQYLAVQFRGFPKRYYSPTGPLQSSRNPELIRFHVRRLRRARVSSALGRNIKKGHQLKMTGPFGSAYFRRNTAARLVLISSGTGFAPIWSIAAAALREKPKRELILIVGARDLYSLYMIPALCWLAQFPNVTIIPTVGGEQGITSAVRLGPPTDYLPALSVDDMVYVAGDPRLVHAVAQIAAAQGVTCFANSFVPATDSKSAQTFLSRTVAWLTPAAKNTAAAPHLAAARAIRR